MVPLPILDSVVLYGVGLIKSSNLGVIVCVVAESTTIGTGSAPQLPMLCGPSDFVLLAGMAQKVGQSNSSFNS